MHTKKLSRLMLAASLAAPAMVFMPMGAEAGTRPANISVANMYLWRGLDVSASDAQVSGTLQYNADSGFYVGGWASSTWAGAGYELDLYGGYAGTAATSSMTSRTGSTCTPKRVLCPTTMSRPRRYRCLGPCAQCRLRHVHRRGLYQHGQRH